MALDKKISQLAAATTLALTDLFVVVASGFTRKITLENLMAIMSGSGIDWIAPTMVSSWANQAAPEQPIQYQKVGKRVYIRGAIQNGVAATIFTLPTGYRPQYRVCHFCCVHDNTNAPDFGHIEILTDGKVQVDHPGSLNNHKLWLNISFALD